MRQGSKRRWVFIYPCVFASILYFYRRIESVRNYPVAYSSALVTVIFGFLVIAASYIVERQDIDISIDLSQLRSKFVGMLVLVVFYLAHIFIVSIGGYWRKLLEDFDGERAAFKLGAHLLTVIVTGVSVSWMIYENSLA